MTGTAAPAVTGRRRRPGGRTAARGTDGASAEVESGRRRVQRPGGGAGGPGAAAGRGGPGGWAGPGGQRGAGGPGTRGFQAAPGGSSDVRPGLVFVQGPNGPEPRMVLLGLNDWDYTEVIRGLEAGEPVILMSSPGCRLSSRDAEPLPGAEQRPDPRRRWPSLRGRHDLRRGHPRRVRRDRSPLAPPS